MRRREDGFAFEDPSAFLTSTAKYKKLSLNFHNHQPEGSIDLQIAKIKAKFAAFPHPKHKRGWRGSLERRWTNHENHSRCERKWTEKYLSRFAKRRVKISRALRFFLDLLCLNFIQSFSVCQREIFRNCPFLNTTSHCAIVLPAPWASSHDLLTWVRAGEHSFGSKHEPSFEIWCLL